MKPGTMYSRRVLREQGMHPRVLASEAITSPLPGLCCRADAPAPLRDVAFALQTVVVPGSVISDETAAELLGLPLPRRLTRREGAALHCRMGRGGARRTQASLIVHQRRPAPTIQFGGLTISAPVTVLQEIAPKLSRMELVACVDALAADRHGASIRVPLQQIRADARSSRGRGARAVRRAANEARERVWSPMETRTRLLICARGYPEPAPNVSVRDGATGSLFYIDLAYDQWRIAIEYDSEHHREDRRTWQRDLHKNEVLHDLGWKVLRISVADFQRPADFFARLDAAIRARMPASGQARDASRG
ncbi:DUF559 domain-containing protein [Brachybacterium sp. GCM10030268]